MDPTRKVQRILEDLQVAAVIAITTLAALIPEWPGPTMAGYEHVTADNSCGSSLCP
jgi:hypothetical protein